MRRAVNNIPWSSSLWCRLFESEERCSLSLIDCSHEVLNLLAERVLKYTFPDPQNDHLKVLMAGCGVTRRAVIDSMENKKDDLVEAVNQMRETFVDALGFLEREHPHWEDGWLSLFQYKIDTEMDIVGKIENIQEIKSKARDDWQIALERWKNSPLIWISCASWFESQLHLKSECKEIYKIAITKLNGDALQFVGEAFMNFLCKNSAMIDEKDHFQAILRKRLSVSKHYKNRLTSRIQKTTPYVRQQQSSTQNKKSVKTKRKKFEKPTYDKSAREVHQREKNENKNPRESKGRKVEAEKRFAKEKASLPLPRNIQVKQQTVLTNDEKSDKKDSNEKVNFKEKSEKMEDVKVTEKEPSRNVKSPPIPKDRESAVVVFNLPFSTKKEQIREIFSSCGNIEMIEFATNKKGYSIGTATITFDTKEAAMQATSMHENKIIKGRNIEVIWLGGLIGSKKADASQTLNPKLIKDESDMKKKDDDKEVDDDDEYKEATSKTVAVENIPDSVDENALKEFFGTCGNIFMVKFLFKRNTNVRNRKALVRFDDKQSVPIALLHSGKELAGSTLTVMKSRFPALASHKQRSKVSYSKDNPAKKKRRIGAPAAFSAKRLKAKELEMPSKPLTNEEFKKLINK
mmetsp:Transcript_8241/g.12490  ORF Transcript_8241/g.12490 Transcript_8241/m.12490 type:complete len:630 (+) Transcript_8241:1-1890(+)